MVERVQLRMGKMGRRTMREMVRKNPRKRRIFLMRR